MAFARFDRNSDVYVYLDLSGLYTCNHRIGLFQCATPWAMQGNLRQHRTLGELVPEEALDQLGAKAMGMFDT